MEGVMVQIRFADEKKLYMGPEQPANNAIAQAATGVGKAVDGLLAFPYTTAHHIFSGPNTFQNNILTRTRDTANHMVYGTADLMTGHLLYSAAKTLGVEQYTPFFSPMPQTIEGIATDVTNLAFLAALPAASRAIKTRMGIPAKAVPVSETALAQKLATTSQKRADTILTRIMAEADTAFAKALESTSVTARARGAKLGAIEIPQWMLPAMAKADFLKIFRQALVSEADLQSLVQHVNADVAAAACQVLAERSNPVPEGYVLIPGGEFKGRTLSPFGYKRTPVTNGEWLRGIDDKRRFVLLTEDPGTLALQVEDVTANPPLFIDPLIDFDAGDIATRGGQILVKLVDNPSIAYDAEGCRYSTAGQPVVGVNYYQAQAWVLTDASGRLALPTDLMQGAVASNFGKQKYGTATGKLYAADGSKLGHFDQWNNGKGMTADVNDPRYLPGPFGAYSQFNVWRWMQADPSQTYSYGLRGGSWVHDSPRLLRAAYRNFETPDYRQSDIGFSPVALPGLPK
jgi:formylglycine-generating enzyme required for sulfatase activity